MLTSIFTVKTSNFFAVSIDLFNSPSTHHFANMHLTSVYGNNVPNLRMETKARLLFYKINPKNEFTIILEILESNLSLVLMQFYPLVGRLMDTPDTGKQSLGSSLEISYRCICLTFIIATCMILHLTLSEYLSI